MIYQYAQQAAGVVSSMAANFQFFARMHTDYGSAAPIWAAPTGPGAHHAARKKSRFMSTSMPTPAWSQLAASGVRWSLRAPGCPGRRAKRSAAVCTT
jgi:ATP-binding cassette subfamily B protein